MNPSVLVIVVTYNSMQWIDRCLSSLRQSSISVDVMIVDNQSSDDSPRYIEEHYPECMIVRNSENKGFGAANNIGLRYAVEKEYDYVYLLNQDAWVKPDTIQILIEEQTSDSSYGIVSPIQLQANELQYDSNFGILISNWKENRDCHERDLTNDTRTLFEIPFVMAAHWLISRECLLAVGGFSPSFYHYGEDDNYCHRAKYHGFKVGFTTRTYAVHDREFRVIDKKKRIYLRYVQFIKSLSDPNYDTALGTKQLIMDTLFLMRREYSILPLKFFCILMLRYRIIRNNCIVSRRKFAFLS